MVKAETTIGALYSKMFHIMYSAHSVHRVAEDLREKILGIDKLIVEINQICLKAPNRIILFKIKVPGIPLPSRPIVTRWG